MITKKSNSHITIIFILFGFIQSSWAQNNKSSDQLYTEARAEAFDNDNYVTAIALMKEALKKSPDYLELGVFLGRLYTFTDSLPKARTTFNEVLMKEAGHEQASLAYGNLEYWNSDSERALVIVDAGLSKHTDSQSLGLLKAKILKDLERYDEARKTLDLLLKKNPKLTEARSIISGINTASVKNEIGANYEFIYFDKRFDDPWHLASIDYARQTKLGSVTARVNYANRFRTNGTQFEIDAYPRISDLFYTYVSGGISSKDGIFPRYRAGFSLYANLPAAFEADAGFRFLAFSENTWIYTLGVGKYYKNYWFNLRTYLTPSGNSVSHSYALTVRYYLGGADDFISLKIGTGLSPDNSANSVLFDPDTIYKLKSSNIALGYRKLLWDTTILTFSGALENQEYARDTRGNQVSLSLGYIKRF
ncbi:YaiO family outer membrane beta-barrel protein [Flavimarina sp. Hel_I_48]|uniref:YaiO family outer membrane beta-barrel protein n=1 Tax=Flavimarina sp. Hel_I_48 TaxID=1392488 RepID=UPI0004DF9A36|nr:YaiO family outer membrane beta-barrel protein [Flavimarina sp. Hel_I_48]